MLEFRDVLDRMSPEQQRNMLDICSFWGGRFEQLPVEVQAMIDSPLYLARTECTDAGCVSLKLSNYTAMALQVRAASLAVAAQSDLCAFVYWKVC